jgi:hypothetical protein
MNEKREAKSYSLRSNEHYRTNVFEDSVCLGGVYGYFSFVILYKLLAFFFGKFDKLRFYVNSPPSDSELARVSTSIALIFLFKSQAYLL